MAHTLYRRSGYVFAVSFSFRGVPRTLRCGRAVAIAMFAILPMIATWYLGATAYYVFHDQLLAALIARQTDAQYAYEDRIAALKTQLDRQTSRGMLDRQALSVAMRDLAERSARLETRAATIDRLVGSMIDPATRAKGAIAAATAETGARLPNLQPDAPARTDLPRDEDHAALDPDLPGVGSAGAGVESAGPQGATLASLLDQVDASQTRQVTQLRDPTLRAVSRLRMALAETGLPMSRFLSGDRGDVGGPFVPLPRDGRGASFDQNIALLQDAVVQHARLIGIVDKVPIRRPIEGRLEVTSPFGARVDPFLGRPAMHTGLDLMDSYGGTVMATARGIVTVAGSEGGYGNMVEVDHGNGLTTRYAHLSSIDVAVHQRVAAGTVLGRVGSSGRATGPHLHYETRIDGEPVDPSRFLKAGLILARP